jgi:hypothetical protein
MTTHYLLFRCPNEDAGLLVGTFSTEDACRSYAAGMVGRDGLEPHQLRIIPVLHDPQFFAQHQPVIDARRAPGA